MLYTLEIANYATMQDAISSIPRYSVTRLDLGYNDLASKPHADNLALINSIPSSVNLVDLSYNDLGRMPDRDLGDALRFFRQ